MTGQETKDQGNARAEAVELSGHQAEHLSLEGGGAWKWFEVLSIIFLGKDCKGPSSFEAEMLQK